MAPKKVKEVEEVDVETTEEAVEETPVSKFPTSVKPAYESLRVAGKDYSMPKFQMVTHGDHVIAYGPTGQHVSPPTSIADKDAVSKLSKFVANSNVLERRKNAHDTSGLSPIGTR